MIKNVLFDFNGTLLNDVTLCFDILEKMLDMVNLPRISLETYKNVFDFPVKEYYEKIGFDFTKNDYNKLSQFFMDEYGSRNIKETSLFEGCFDALITLKKEGYNLYILSASEENMLMRQLKFLKIDQFFDGIAAASNKFATGKVEYGKEFIKKHKLKKDETIMIGDTSHDFVVAKELGLKSLLFSLGHNSINKLKLSNAPIANNYQEIVNYIRTKSN